MKEILFPFEDHNYTMLIKDHRQFHGTLSITAAFVLHHA